MRTYIKAYMSLNFGQIPPLTTELAALERLKIDVEFEDIHKSLYEFEFPPDQTTDYGVSCP